MRSKKKALIFLLLSMGIFFMIFSINTPVAYCTPTLHKAWSSMNSKIGASYYSSRVDLQGHCVYEDDTGTADYAIFVYGKNLFWNGWYTTLTKIYLFVSAHYYYVYDQGNNENYWAPAPTDLIIWDSDWTYNPNGEAWFWRIDNNEYYCTHNDVQSTSNVNTGTSESISTDGIWRYLGYVSVRKQNANHIFDALIKLQIDNDKGDEYHQGRRGYDPDKGWYTQKITEIQIRIVVTFYFLDIFGYHADASHNHILGDGTGQGDLSSIPLIEGIVEGLG